MAEKFGHTIQYTEILLGGASIDVHGVPLTEEAIEAAKSKMCIRDSMGTLYLKNWAGCSPK